MNLISKGNLIVGTDKQNYQNGDVARITANAPEGADVKATLDKGTRFEVKLPFSLDTELPLIGRFILSELNALALFLWVAIVVGMVSSQIIQRFKTKR